MKNMHYFLIALIVGLFVQAADEVSWANDVQEYFEKVFPASEKQTFGRLVMAAEWRIWIPKDVQTLRGVVVHQHGCGSGSCDGGRTAVYDLHWQELARKHDCALMAVSYRQDDFDCQMWCDPRNGSAQSFLDALQYFADYTGHDELTRVPWALWGHSGGGHWVGSMCQLYPKRIVGAWLRSGCPDTVGFTFNELPMNDDVIDVPMMLNLGAHEHDFAIVWNSCWAYFQAMRRNNAKIGLIIDPKTSHETGDSRYPAIRFLDECLSVRLSFNAGDFELRPTPEGYVLPIEEISDAEISAENIVIDSNKPDGNYTALERREFLKDGLWFLNREYVDVWRKYSIDCSFEDTTPPPPPTDVVVNEDGLITWKCRADLESGLKTFIVYCDGAVLQELQGAPVCNARPTFQGVMYSDTPDYSAPKMEYSIKDYDSSRSYSVVSVNCCDLKSEAAIAIKR